MDPAAAGIDHVLIQLMQRRTLYLVLVNIQTASKQSFEHLFFDPFTIRRTDDSSSNAPGEQGLHLILHEGNEW